MIVRQPSIEHEQSTLSAAPAEFRVPSRILVTGNAGSGKSTVARQLGEVLSLPTYGLDSILWQPGWRAPPAHERERLLAELAGRSRWVIDGVARVIEQRAQLVIFLDVAPLRCTWRCAKRNWRYLFRSRPGLPDHCPEWRIIPTLLRIIWNFSGTVRPAILSRARDANSTAVYWHVCNELDRADVIRRLQVRASAPGRDVAA